MRGMRMDQHGNKRGLVKAPVCSFEDGYIGFHVSLRDGSVESVAGEYVSG